MACDVPDKTSHPKVGAVVLAGGKSERMGTSKQLLPFAGKTVIEHIVSIILSSRVSETVVVLGHRPERITSLLDEYNVSIVENVHYERGMLSSLRAGLYQAPETWDGILVTLGDQPSLGAEVIDSLIAQFEGYPEGIHVPAYEGRRGHPLLLSARFRDEIMSKHDDEGLRGLLRAHPERVRQFPCESASVLDDMDYPEDYRREVRAFEERQETRR